MGDVSWLTPAAQFNTVCFAADAPGHSWQNVSCGASSIGDKGLLLASKVLACTAIDLFEDTTLIEKAREEHAVRTEEFGGFVSPIPEDAKPIAI